MNRYKKLLSNTLIFAVGTFASKVMVYLLMPLYTYLLTTSESSVADFITSTANLLTPIAAIGIYDAVFRFAIDAGDRKKVVFSSGMCVLTAGSLLFLLFSPILFLFDAFGGYNWLIIVYVISANYQSMVSYYIRGLGDSKGYAIQGIVNTALTIGFNLLFLIVFDWGILGYVLSVVVANVLVTLLIFIWKKLYRDLGIRYIEREVIREMLKYSIPLIPTTVMWFLTSLTDRMIVREYCGDAINGLFVYAYKIPTVIALLSSIFLEAWNLSAVSDATDTDRGSFFSGAYESYMGIIFMAASGLVAFTKIFSRILLDVSYYAAWQYMPTLIVATGVSALATFMGSVYVVNKKSVLSFVTAAVGAVSNIILSWVMAPFWGVQGVALATIISYAAVFALRALNTQKYVRFNMHPIRFIVNIVLISVQAIVMIAEVRGWMILQAAILSAMLVINGKPILEGVLLALRNRKRPDADGNQ